MIITFAGALILIRPEFSNLYVEPVALVSIFGAICLGLEAIFIKLLTKYEKNTQILLINNFIGLILSSLIDFFLANTNFLTITILHAYRISYDMCTNLFFKGS